MTKRRYYTKENPEKALSEEVEKEISLSSHIGSNVSIPPSSYIKSEATQLPKAFLVIFSGGEKRERDYFYLIEKNPNLYPNIKIDFWAEDRFRKGGDPLITEFASRKVQEYKESASEENLDSYFLLTDVDHFEQFLVEMKKECQTNNIELIISNSCFEVWLYYAEKEDRCIGFSIPDNKLDISKHFKKWANTQIKGGLKPNKALLKIEQNITNAEKNYAENKELPTLFSTQMFRLAKKMLPFVEAGNKRILLNKNSSFNLHTPLQ